MANILSFIQRFSVWAIRLFRQLKLDVRVHIGMRDGISRPLGLRILDQLRLLVSSGITAKEYYIQELWNPNLATSRKLEYLGAFCSGKWQTAISAKSYTALMDDKLLFDVILQTAGVATATTYALYSKTAPNLLCHSVIRDSAALEKWLLKSQENIFIKPLHGKRGMGTLSIGKRLVSAQPSWEQLPMRQPLSLDAIVAHVHSHGAGNFIIQKRLTPCMETAKFSEDVLQTLRVMTVWIGTELRLVAAAIKISSGKSAVDNLLGGGNMIAAVNLDNSELGAAAEIVSGKPVWHSFHPVSGAPIESVRLSNLADIKILVVRAAESFPWFKSVGWDVALTADGPLILEGNYWADVILIQIAHRTGLLSWPDYRKLFDENFLYRRTGMGFMQPSST